VTEAFEPSGAAPVPGHEAVLEELSRVLASPTFAASSRHRDFLRYVVSRQLTEPEAELKELTLALDVFGRNPADYDPRLDTIVRVEARRLRARLEQYYAGDGAANPIRIDLPKGSYSPVFTRSTASAAFSHAGAPAPERELDAHVVRGVVGTPETDAVPTATPAPRGFGRFAVVAAALMALVAAALFLVRKPDDRAVASVSGTPSVAVLPLFNASGDPSLEPFLDGLTDEITDALTRIPGLKVIARTSAFKFKGKSEDVREVGRLLGVTTVVEGSVQRSGNQLKVIAQLNRTDDGSHLWSQVFTIPHEELFALQTRITRSVAAALGPALEAEVIRQKRGTTNWPAWEAYSRGLFALHRGAPDAYPDAFTYFSEAVRLDPSFAAALARRGYARVLAAAQTNAADAETRRLGRADIEAAVAMDPGQSHLLANIAGMVYLFEYDWPAAESIYKRALEFSPSEATPHAGYAGALMLQGRAAEAEAEYARALGISPLDFLANLNLAAVPLFGGDPAASIPRLESFASVHPGNLPILASLMRAQVVTRNVEGARRTMIAVRAADASPSGDYRTFCEIALAAIEGDISRARTLLQDAERTLGGSYSYNLGAAHALLGDAPKAAKWLVQAVRRGESYAAYIPVDPILDPIRFAPEFRLVWNAIPKLTASLPYPGPFAKPK
jgi:TolB-like protein